MVRSLTINTVRYIILISAALIILCLNDSFLGIIVALITLIFLIYQNGYIRITKYDLEYEDLPKDLENLKIMQISDFHNKKISNHLINSIQKEKVDLIFLTGDIMEDKHNKSVRHLIDILVDIAPVYYVTGNHEFYFDINHFYEFEKYMIKKGVHVLRNKSVKYKSAKIIGIDDEKLEGFNTFKYRVEKFSKEDGFKILLVHRPEYAEAYFNLGYNLVFSGHAHGGQIRIPKIGPIFAPGQKIFPKYAEGICDDNHCKIVINRGIGDSIVPQRLFNRPEIVVATLKGI